MQTEHIEEFAEAYALGALDQTERAWVELHADACPACRRLLMRAEDTAHLLVLAVPPVAPPAHCKRKVLERVEREHFLATPARRSRMHLPYVAWTTVAMLTLLLAFGGAWMFNMHRQLAHLRAEAALHQAEVELMRTSIAGFVSLDNAVSNAKAVRSLEGEGLVAKAMAKMYMNPGRHKAVLEIMGLPQLPPGQIYQVWIARDDSQRPLMMFNMTEPVIRFEIESPEPVDRYEWVMVTVEDADGATQPSNRIVLAGDL
jgi:hypothetical protein